MCRGICFYRVFVFSLMKHQSMDCQRKYLTDNKLNDELLTQDVWWGHHPRDAEFSTDQGNRTSDLMSACNALRKNNVFDSLPKVALNP